MASTSTSRWRRRLQVSKPEKTWRVGIPRPATLGGTPEKLFVTVEQDETGAYVAECPAIPGCVSQGATEQEALENIREAMELCLQVREEQRLPLSAGHTSEVDKIGGIDS
ncbi:MAG: type II toxin-antitoxin system HicB family antitoxin [Armatimonadetes bacterium]|nr:type II toxin-antitoxin system HicB family antitoxin [Armatimonadota bacterium]